MPRRILHISTRLILGGSQENTVLSCEGQHALGHEVHLAFGPIFGPEGSMLDRVQQTPQITTHEIPSLVRELAPVQDVRALRSLGALIERIKPDIVHTHSSKAGILGRNAASLASPKLDRPLGIVHTIHGPPFMPLEGSAAQRAKTFALNTVYELAEKQAALTCHAIVSVADAMTQQFLDRGIGEPSLYTTVRSGIDLAPYRGIEQQRDAVRSELGIEARDRVVGTVARLAQHKGHDDLLDALAENMRTDPSLKLLWVGDGWWKDRLLARADDLGIRPQIIHTGLVPPHAVPRFITAMDLLAHPSYREGLPRTVPQALLCGVCPVAYDADGTREACIDGETGRLVPVGDVSALGAAIRELLADDARRAGLAAEGKAMIERGFGARVMVDELEKVYDAALAAAER